MDRFIAQCTVSRHLQKGNLKSNMDRFIAKNLTSIKISKKIFKIQYG